MPSADAGAPAERSWPDPRAAVDRLAAADTPYLIGVRHHSPVVAAAVPALLEAMRPDVVLVELPMEFADWLPWIGHPEAGAPLALAGSRRGGDGPLAFYPLADFSPELVAIRWALRNQVPVEPCDLPAADRAWERDEPGTARDRSAQSIADLVRRRLTGRTGGDLWDRLVEVGAAGSTAESVRRAALAVGWALRHDGGELGSLDRAREAWMRTRIAQASGRVVAVVGAFHAPALVDGPVAASTTQPATTTPEIVTSLVAYPFQLLDSRSGYPAGIRDPQWQQEVYDCGADPIGIEDLTVSFAVRVAAALRAAGHPAGPAEAREAARLATGLARLRGLAAPGRAEVVEALQTVYAQGEVLGRGRAVAAAMEATLVGDRLGRLAPGTPRSGLVPAVLDELAAVRLPGPGRPPQTLRLDPLRSRLDRSREVTLIRLHACGVPYAAPGLDQVGGVGGTDALTTVWQVGWGPATEATLAVAGMYGVTLEQATAGWLRTRRHDQVAGGGPTAQQALDGFTAATAAGLPDLSATRLDDVERTVGAFGTLSEIIDGLERLDRVARGHVPGTPEPPARCAEVTDVLEAASVREIAGLAGSDRTEDARALVAVAHRADTTGRMLRLRDALRGLADTGTPLMQGVGGAVGVLMGVETAEGFGERLASWIDTGGDELRPRLTGALLAAAWPSLRPMLRRVEEMTDAAFVRRLPALRGGFDALSPAARDRLFADIEDRFGRLDLEHDPEVLQQWLGHDQAGRAAILAGGLLDADADADADAGAEGVRRAGAAPRDAIPAGQRWRLVLGRRTEELAPAIARRAHALDELYGSGRGEGSREVGPGGGRATPLPGAREWREELEELFGAEVCQEVLGEAARRGNRGAALELAPETVRPSVELLHSILSLAGGLPETQLTRLRPLVAKVVAELSARLAVQLRPALTGLTTARPTRRRTGTVDLPATIRANLRAVTTTGDGRRLVVPERVRYKSRARRSVDWRLVLVVDVSGSMEASTVWSALTAAVLAALPAVTTHFVTFSTRVVDLSGQVDDPLSLLLEVSVGGGTDIAAGLRYARGLVTVPTRTMVVVVSDFEDGYSIDGLLGEVRALVESGCRLIGCASLDDQARPRYAVGVAEQLVASGMPVAALSPLALARWVAEQVTT